MKDYSQMSDHELLMELVKEKRRNDKLRYIRYGFSALVLLAVVIVAAIYVPKIVAVIRRYNQFMDQMEGLNDKVSSFVNEGTVNLLDSVKEIMEKVQSLFGKFGF
ncbi:MAG: hypothetical protein IJF87_00760 [Erysipelotrichaceae bacterium]|nr:hypothetical protein [Erysipelotrichaceae bacterium]